MEQNESQVQEMSANITTSHESVMNASALQIRLDTSKILEDFEQFLRGEYITLSTDYKTQQIIRRRIKVGRPKANDLGVQSLLNYLSLIINAQTVQGNFTEEYYIDYLIKVHVDLISAVVENSHLWDIRTEDFNIIVDSMMNMIEPFMSRLLFNKERDSYGMQTRDSNTIVPQKKGIGIFKR